MLDEQDVHVDGPPRHVPNSVSSVSLASILLLAPDPQGSWDTLGEFNTSGTPPGPGFATRWIGLSLGGIVAVKAAKLTPGSNAATAASLPATANVLGGTGLMPTAATGPANQTGAERATAEASRSFPATRLLRAP